MAATFKMKELTIISYVKYDIYDIWQVCDIFKMVSLMDGVNLSFISTNQFGFHLHQCKLEAILLTVVITAGLLRYKFYHSLLVNAFEALPCFLWM